jgi:hypothetical protein
VDCGVLSAESCLFLLSEECGVLTVGVLSLKWGVLCAECGVLSVECFVEC